MSFYKRTWFFELLGVIALSVLIWFLGESLEVGIRLSALTSCFAVWGGWQFYKQLKATQKTARLVSELTLTPEQEAAEEIATLNANLSEALETLKKMRTQGVENNHYLQDLPWYLLIGPPGSGKTTALMNSGLEFPLANTVGKHKISGIGGTRHCDWWFTDQAVILDSAGRYTTQDSHEAVDKAAWHGFLELLKKRNPRRPLNGVLITLSLVDLLKQSEEERLLHAKAIRNRIDELYQCFGIQIPVYMLFTKADLVAGFTDFFADLGKEERAQVWGVTFSADKNTDNLARVSQDFDDLCTRLQTGLFKRLQEERDLQRRGLIFAFPQQMGLLKENLLSFLQACYGINRYQTMPYLRGVYFTSSTQEGTPLDRLMGILAETFNLNRVQSPLFSGKGKSYFLTRLLKEVIFAESLLVGANWQLEKRYALYRHALYYFSVLLLVACSGLWFISFEKNNSAINNVDKEIEKYDDILKKEQNLLSLAEVLKQLDITVQMKDAFNEPSLFMKLGLYQGDDIQKEITQRHQDLVNKQLVPRILEKFATQLNNEQDAKKRYALLKAYLMFGDSKRFDSKFIKQTIRTEIKPEEQSEKVIFHLDSFFKKLDDKQLNKNQLDVKLDDNLITKTRAFLKNKPVHDYIYEDIKNAELSKNKTFDLLDNLGKNGQIVFQPDKKTISAFFTPKGSKTFLTDSIANASNIADWYWVLGNNTLPLNEQNELKKDYAQDYIETWDALLNNLKIQPITDENKLKTVQSAFVESPAPVSQLLELVKKQTTLGKELPEVERHFSNLTGFIGKEIPLIEAVKNIDLKNPDTVNQLQKEVMTLPQPLKTMMQDFASDIQKIIVNAAWKTVMEEYKTTKIKEYYPFNKKGSDIGLNDFSHFFAPNGIFDVFFATYQNVISPAALKKLQAIKKIQMAFFSTGNTPLVNFSLKPIALSSNAESFLLKMDDKKADYNQADMPDISSFQWKGDAKGVNLNFAMANNYPVPASVSSSYVGEWGVFKALEAANIHSMGDKKYKLTFEINGLSATYELTADSTDNPFSFAFRNINFPESLQ